MRRFALATGDSNPLHLDESFARRTPYGRCIAHGALVAMAALGVTDPSTLRRARSLDLRFTRPVFPGDPLTLHLRSAVPGRVVVEAWTRGQLSTRVAVEADAAADLPSVPAWPKSFLSAARQVAVSELEATPAYRHGACYAPDIVGLRSLAAELGAGDVPDALLGWLAAASYTVGMLVPGVEALFASAHLERAEGFDSPRIEATAWPPQPASGLLEVQARFGHGTASARMQLRAFIRTRPPGPQRATIAEHLPMSRALESRDMLVVGASRGLGAAIVGALASQGATVWAGYAQSTGSVETLRQEFGSAHVRPVRLDALDSTSVVDALEHVASAAVPLDGVVFCAAPPLHDLVLHRDAAPIAITYVEQCLAMTLHPLVEALPRVRPGGWLVFVSSSAVADPPAAWSHYVAAKGAIEALAAHCARHSGLRVAIVRPPRMWTDMTNGPTGALGAAAPEAVAASIVQWVLDDHGKQPLLEPEYLNMVQA